MRTRKYGRSLAALVMMLALGALAAAGERNAIPITTVEAVSEDLEIWQATVGEVMARNSPRIAAEVGGRVTTVHADVGARVEAGDALAEIDPTDYRLARDLTKADIQRLKALIEAQRLQVERLRKLVTARSVTQSKLDDAEAQLGALRAQLTAARVRRQQAQRSLERTRIVSPVAGRVARRMISVGDYLKPGTPVFEVTGVDALQARLPFPETVATRFRLGQPVRLRSPLKPAETVERSVTAISPNIEPGNLAVWVWVNFENPGAWEPGGSVTGEVRVAVHENAVVVPEGCVVRRPAGEVVYRIVEDQAQAVPVQTGLRQQGRVEILSGIEAGDRLALDGAAFLTDGTAVTLVDRGDGS